MIVAFSNHYKT